MVYNDIDRVLKRYSFEEKMKIAFENSTKLIEAYLDSTNNPNKFFKLVYPWELETFVILSIKSKEWKNDIFSTNKIFVNIINAIRNKNNMILSVKTKNFSTIEKIMIPLSANQFDFQEDLFIRFYRFNYYFNFFNDEIDMRNEFFNKFKCKYDDFIFISFFLWMFFCCDLKNNYSSVNDVYKFLYMDYESAINCLTISREEYINEIDSITNDPNNYVICFKPSYKYPFVEYNKKIFLPLPHLLIRASTSSLMYRLTDGNQELSEKIGKEIYESYILKIISESNMFDEVLPEQTYRNSKGEELKTLDVLTRKDNNYFLFDSKSFSPKIDLRVLSDEAYQKDLLRIAQAYKQLYNHLRKYIDKELSFFENKVVDKTNIFGIAIIREEPFFDKNHIYHKTAELLNIYIDSKEYKWLCKHVTHISINILEKYCFCNINIVDSILESYNDAEKNELDLSYNYDHLDFTNNNFCAFKDSFCDNFKIKIKNFFENHT